MVRSLILCLNERLAPKKAAKAMDLDKAAVDDDFDIKQELLEKRGAEGMMVMNFFFPQL